MGVEVVGVGVVGGAFDVGRVEGASCLVGGGVGRASYLGTGALGYAGIGGALVLVGIGAVGGLVGRALGLEVRGGVLGESGEDFAEIGGRMGGTGGREDGLEEDIVVGGAGIPDAAVEEGAMEIVADSGGVAFAVVVVVVANAVAVGVKPGSSCRSCQNAFFDAVDAAAAVAAVAAIVAVVVVVVAAVLAAVVAEHWGFLRHSSVMPIADIAFDVAFAAVAFVADVMTVASSFSADHLQDSVVDVPAAAETGVGVAAVAASIAAVVLPAVALY